MRVTDIGITVLYQYPVQVHIIYKGLLILTPPVVRRPRLENPSYNIDISASLVKVRPLRPEVSREWK
jgi:hypothetical protein